MLRVQSREPRRGFLLADLEVGLARCPQCQPGGDPGPPMGSFAPGPWLRLWNLFSD
jgi:hypothetical protein